MFTLGPNVRKLLIATLCFCLNITLLAVPSKLESNSPFLPPGYSNQKPVAPRPVPQANNPLARELEFRGVVQLNGVYQFSLFKISENRGYWISENGSENGISVSNFDSDGMRITVTLNGRSEQLTLMTASDSPLPVVATQSRAPQAKIPPQAPNIPALRNSTKNVSTSRRTIPRRRVILPPKK